MYFLQFQAFFLIFRSIACTDIVEYYENLIAENVAKAQDYQLPQSNIEFTAGVQSDKINDFGSYDFIIVGAGSAGGVLATRLSEIDDFNILLLEAGGEENDFSQIPAMLWYLQFSEMNWGYYSTPQKNCCLGMKDQKCISSQGKSIGGTSAINALIPIRGNREDYKRWAKGWSYEEVLPYFIKSENSQIDGDPGYHGKGGLWNVEYTIPLSNITKNFIQGNLELGRKVVDYNGRDQLGVSKTQTNVKEGRRQSTGTAYLADARKRKNLKLVKKALVTKINMDKKGQVAEGVLFVKDNKKFRATATKEVIVSGGAINSPQLLMLSGIGPKDHLKEMEIDLIKDLPVGKNLIDHPLFPGLTFNTNYTSTNNNMTKLIVDYLHTKGPLTKPANGEGIGLLHTKTAPKNSPMIEYLFISPNSTAPILSRVFNYNDELVNNYLNKINPSTTVALFLVLLHPKSRGTITLKSSNPLDFPNIDLNLFSESEDVDNFIEGIDFIVKLTETDAFKKINATLVDFPICGNFKNYSKSFWACILRQMSLGVFEYTATTPMGSNPKNSVVDSNLKVHGIQKLRVVDAGVIPSPLSGGSNAPTMMVAEKISDVIKSDYVKNYKGLEYSQT